LGELKGIFMKKLFIAFVLCFTSFTACAAGLPEYIKIGLKYGGSAVSECVVKCENGFSGEVNTDEKELRLLVTPEGNIDVLKPGDAMPIYAYKKNDNPLHITPKSGNIFFNGTEYRGELWFIPADSGIKDSSPSGGESPVGAKMTVINELLIEDYLKSVVPSEMPASWHSEALKAQAVCARNYALTNMNKYSKYGFNLDDTVNSQVYNGVKSEYPASTAAVNDTAGKALRYNGELVSTLFYSSSGGRTENVKYVWGNELPYLLSVDDPYEEPSDWTVHFTPSEIGQKLSAGGIDIGDVLDLEIALRSDSGRVINLIIKGSAGEHVLKLENTRSFFNLRSNHYSINKNREGGYMPNIITAKGIFPLTSGIITPSGIKDIPVTRIMTKNGITEVSGGTVTGYDFVGKGFGHGAGLSQYGAKGFAENGYTYEQILRHYYTGVYLE
jgi:stage II sporulation protein D